MAKKKKMKRQKKPKMVKVDPKEYEVEQYGPLKLERFGRYVRLSSHWEPEEFKQHLETVKANREPFRQEINEKIRELISLIEEYDPLELLSALAPKNVFADPETLKESTHEGKESYVEYALSLALSVKNPKLGVHATKEAIERFNTLIDEIFNSLIWYFGIVVLDEEDQTKQELRFRSLLSYLMLRGDSYPAHHIDLVKGLFETHEKFFIDNYGFSVNQVIPWIEELESQAIVALNRYAALGAKMREMHEIFIRFTDEQGADAFSSMQECMSAYNLLPEVQAKRKELEALHEKLDRFIFELKPGEKLPHSFLDLISSEFGDNEAFASFEKSPGWPTNDSIIYRRPLISLNGKYYCFATQIIYRNLVSILEALIREKDTVYFETKYQMTRGHYLVHKALEYFGNILPGAKIYEGLYYEIVKDGQKKRAETDGIIIFDTNLFLIEGKAGSLTTPARRGALSRLKHDISELIDKAYEQALRTRTFISEAEKPKFEYENGAEALVLDNKKMFKNIFLINITLENLGYLATQLSSLKNLNLISGKEWPWSVFLNDLRVISEIIETPSEFLVYLKRRLRANDYPQFQAPDELDFLMYYLREGLYFEDDKLKDLGAFTPHAYTEDLDRYYNYQAGMVSSGEKPRLKIPEKFKTLVRKIESIGKQGFSEVSATLLGFSVETMEDILSNIEHARLSSLSDGRDHDFTLIFSPLSLGVTISVSSNGKGEQIKKVSDYCELKMYQLKLRRWIFLAVDIKDDEEDTYEFRLFNKEWTPDPQMEKALGIFRRRKLEQFFASGNEIGRNDLCPCNSGIKYKKCCGSAI
jgi:hypothetical protein